MSPCNIHSSDTGGNCRPCHPPLTSGVLATTSPQVIARLLDEGVPVEDVSYIAIQARSCADLLMAGEDLVNVVAHAWTWKLVDRYGDKLQTIFWTTRGRVEAL
jgi:hypothetical protein